MNDSQIFDTAVTEAHANDPVETVDVAPTETPADTDAAASSIVDNVENEPALDETSTNSETPVENAPELDADGKLVEKAATTNEDDPIDEEELAGIDTSLKAVQALLEKPELKAYAAAHPELKAQLGYMARKADRAKSYDDLFHSPSFAKGIKIAADEMYKLDDLYNAEDPKEFLNALISNSFVYDAEGKPKIDANGRPETTGAYERLAATWQEHWISDITAHATALKATQHEAAQADGEELTSAIEVINRVLFGGKGPQASRAAAPQDDTDLEGLSPALKQEILAARSARAGAGDADKTSLSAFSTKVETAVTEARSSFISKLVDNLVEKNPKIVMTPFMKKSIVRNASETLNEKLSKDVARTSSFKQFVRSVPRDDKGLATVVSSEKAMLREIAPRILRAAFEEATSTVVKTAGAKDAKITAGLKNKSIPTTGGARPSTVNRDEKVEKALEDKTKAVGGRRLTDKEIMETVTTAYHDK